MIRDSFKQDLEELIHARRIKGIERDDDISIKIILENIQLVDESKNIADILLERGWLYSLNNKSPFNLKLPFDLQSQITHEKSLREAGKAVVIAGAIGIGALVVSEVVKKNQCVLF